jgi:hypothetical protein
MDPTMVALLLSAVNQGLKYAMNANQLADSYRKGEITREAAQDLLRAMQAEFQAGDEAYERAGEDVPVGEIESA